MDRSWCAKPQRDRNIESARFGNARQTHGERFLIPYWLLFLVPLLGVLSRSRRAPVRRNWNWWIVGLIVALMVGLRFEVGGDWNNYQRMLYLVSDSPFSFVFELGDPGYYALVWLTAQFGDSQLPSNLVCAVFVAFGLVAFCRAQPNPWLALLAAVPYLVIVVAMGYTRQSVALAFAMLGLVSLGRGLPRWFVLWVLVGALFHKTVLVMLPIAALAAARNRVWTAVWVAAVASVGAWLFVADSAESLWVNYVDSDYAFASEGGAIRVAMNVVPAVILLAFRKRLVPDPIERRLWWWMAVLALACVPLLQLSPTGVDRVALYLIPLQLYVFSRLPRLTNEMRKRTLLTMAVIGYYAAVQFVWLNFATHAPWWVPYKFAPFV